MGQLLDGEHVGKRVRAGSAVLLGDHHAEEAQLGELREDLVREAASLLPLGHAGRDLGLAQTRARRRGCASGPPTSSKFMGAALTGRAPRTPAAPRPGPVRRDGAGDGGGAGRPRPARPERRPRRSAAGRARPAGRWDGRLGAGPLCGPGLAGPGPSAAGPPAGASAGPPRRRTAARAPIRSSRSGTPAAASPRRRAGRRPPSRRGSGVSIQPSSRWRNVTRISGLPARARRNSTIFDRRAPAGSPVSVGIRSASKRTIRVQQTRLAPAVRRPRSP